MAGNLVQVSRATSTGSSASLKVTGIDSSNAYVVFFSIKPVDNDKDLYIRVTTSGTADSDSEYDYTSVFFRADASFSNGNAANNDKWGSSNSAMENDTAKWCNANLWLFNFNESSEYSYMTIHTCGWNDTVQSVSDAGGGVHTVQEANDGIELTWESASNFASGSELVLFKVEGS